MKETKRNNKEMVTIKLFSIQGEYILGQNLQGVNYLEKAVEKEFTKGELIDTSYWVTTFEMPKEMIPQVTEQLFKEIENDCPKAEDMADDDYFDFVPDALDQFTQFGYHTEQLDTPDFQDDLVLLRNILYAEDENGTLGKDAYKIENYFDGPYMFGLTWEEI